MAKYKAYPEYKDSGVEWLGKIPGHWDVFIGKRVFQSVRTSAHKNDEQLAASQKFGVIPQSLMMQLNDSKVMLALKGTDSFRHVDENNFVISLRSFEGGIEHSKYSGCVSPAYTVLKNTKPLSYGYYRYLLKCAPFIAALQSSTDSLRDGKSINYEQFGAICLPITSFFEQTRISAFLDHATAKIDNLIEKQQQLIELLKEKRQAVISHAVTKGLNSDVPMKDSGVEWLGEVPTDWNILPLKNIVNIINGSTPKSDIVSYWGGDVNWITPTDLSQKKNVYIHESQRKITLSGLNSCGTNLVPSNSIILSTRAPIGSLAITYTTACTNQGCKSLVVKTKESSLFLYYYLSISEVHLNNLGRGSTFLELSSEDLGSFRVPFPNVDIEKITTFLDLTTAKIDLLIQKQLQQIELLKERRTALISAAVTGKIDVRDWTAPAPQQQKAKLSEEALA